MSTRLIAIIAAAASILTVAACYLLLRRYSATPDMLIGVGTLLGSCATAITFFWLVAGHHHQSHQLQSQREALKLQQQELDLHRQSLHHLVSGFSAHVYLTALANAKITLARDCRSILVLYGANHDFDLSSLDKSVESTGNHDIYANAILDNAEIQHYISLNRQDLVVMSAVDSFNGIYEQVRALAGGPNSHLQLFTITMQNSAYQHVYNLLNS